MNTSCVLGPATQRRTHHKSEHVAGHELGVAVDGGEGVAVAQAKGGVSVSKRVFLLGTDEGADFINLDVGHRQVTHGLI